MEAGAPLPDRPELLARTETGTTIDLSARRTTVPANRHWPSVWAHSAGFNTNLPLGTSTAGVPVAASHLPTLYVIDRQGKLRLHAMGRMPADVWDTIADLL